MNVETPSSDVPSGSSFAGSASPDSSGAGMRLRRTVSVVRYGERAGVSLVMIDDLEDLSPKRVVLPEPIVPLVFHLLDGTRDRTQVAADWTAVTGQPVSPGVLDRLLARLDEGLLIEGPSVERARRDALADYRALGRRPMAHAGSAYPADAQGLRDRMNEIRDQAGVPSPDAPVHAVLAPHIDPRGGGPCHGAAVQALAASPAEVFVVFGTAHRPLRRAFALTSLDYETPTGRLATDRDLVARLARCGGEDLLEDERQHGAEHSVEFQAVWIHALHGARPNVRIVPVLVGSLHPFIENGGSPMEDPVVRDFVHALREIREECDGRIAMVASVDFAHVGPNYGWPKAPDAAALARVMEQDRRLLATAVEGDAEAWMRFLHEEKDERSVCGAAPTYVFLRAIEGWGLAGRSLRHDLWEIDPETGSHVSFATVAYVRPRAERA